MKFASAIVLLALACYVNSAVLVPEDVPVQNKPGECPSGLPVDGRFKSCALNPDAWRIGARTYGDAISESDINFSTDFAFPSPLLAEELTNDTTSTCAVRIPASGVVFQHMEYLLHAHYRLTGCAKVHGRSPCRIEVRDFYNRIVDKIEFPWNNVTCSSNRANCLEWTSGSSFEWRNITIRYEGHVPADIAVLMASDSLNLNDTSSAVTFSVMPGDEFTLTGADFSSSGSSSDVLPSRLAFITNNNWVDILSLSDVPTALPGQRFGDQSRFLMAKAGVSDKWLCPISEGADLLTCPCEDAEVEQVCMESLKGFVADPEHEYYIGLVSDECSCEFDNICLTQVGNQEGYFGLNWILNNNSSRS